MQRIRGDFNWFYGEPNVKDKPKATKVKAHPPRPAESYRAARRRAGRGLRRSLLAREERHLVGLSRSDHDRARRQLADLLNLGAGARIQGAVEAA